MSVTRRGFIGRMTALAASLKLPGARASAQKLGVPSVRADGALASDTYLFLERPAAKWQDTFPVGNGRLGAMVFGGVKSERLALNDDTLWSGGPRDWNNPGARQHLPIVRKLVLEDKDYQAADEECHKMEGPWNQNYEPLGDLLLDMAHAGDNTSYVRSLDLDGAMAKVEYTVSGVRYTREVFASFPDDIIVARLTASQPGKITATLRMKGLLRSSSSSHGTTLLLTGKAPQQSLPDYLGNLPAAVVYSDVVGEGMHFASVVHVNASGGTVSAQPDGSLQVAGASSVVLTIGCATGYRGFAVKPDLPLEQVVAKARAAVDRAANVPYEQLLARHGQDHQALFRRVSLALPSTPDASLPTDKRVDAFAQRPDPSLLVLFFNLGRYLLISSSRPGSEPANLQGVWNPEVRPPWSCNYTTNINVEMNYWMAETCNLSECHLPLIAMVKDLSVNGAKTAEVNYGAPGWCAHHNVDLWRQSAPAGNGEAWAQPTWANWPMAGVWLCAHLWAHYRFTGDRQYLREVYPVMRGAAEFCAGWLIDDGQGGLTTCPSVSPENFFVAPNGQMANVSAGTTMDIALIREIFANTTEAGKLLGVDAAFRERIAHLTERLPPYRIGHLGQLQEWSIDFEEKFPGMRHMSHLYPLYPGEQITPRGTPQLAAAARKSLERRLEYAFKEQGAFTGWGRAWTIALWARLHDGDMAWDSLKILVNHSLNNNLFDDINDTHSKPDVLVSQGVPDVLFQIDANLGAPGGIAEMLLQSHEGEIAFLPAIPSEWTHGKVQGLRARGGLEAAIEWSSPTSSQATVQALRDSTFRFRAPAGQRLRTLSRRAGASWSTLPLPAGDRSTFALDAQKGDTFRFTFAS